ncbi:hypothetical protein [Fulvivirga lutea]|uniref:DUF2029 domain-containing protein n=1 Tax=Fulvivirga lutea TaxID=2810512 RepID=A0A974WFU2_9BACT|nr:hypothetical protein [Fulvivirga lutea]QSE97471.1 hypothetical protein JR347_18125 [Fulvivirga lutea]
MSIILYVQIAFFIQRFESGILIPAYTLVFICYIVLVKNYSKSDVQINYLLGLAFLVRFLLVFAFPSLSDDIYRFIWDGRLLNAGIHPFSEVPSFYMISGNEMAGLDQSLYTKLNSPEYFTIYPPFAQFIYWVSTLATDSIYISNIIIKSLIFLAEVGSIIIGLKLLERYKLQKRNILMYALNPLVILELTGNVHFEAFMIFFLLLSVYLMHQYAIVKSGFYMAASIASKLIPVIFLPLFLRRLKLAPLIRWYAAILVFSLLFFIPLFQSDFVHGMGESLGLYFQKFEFNASIYYIIREIGYWFKGYNIIGTAGKFLALASFLSIMGISLFYRKNANIFELMMLALTVYLLLSTTVHPWYVTTILMVSIFTKFRFTIVWSLLIFFTYIGYTETGFQENMLIVILEYVVIVTILIDELYEVSKNRTPWLAKNV